MEKKDVMSIKILWRLCENEGRGLLSASVIFFIMKIKRVFRKFETSFEFILFFFFCNF